MAIKEKDRTLQSPISANETTVGSHQMNIRESLKTPNVTHNKNMFTDMAIFASSRAYDSTSKSGENIYRSSLKDKDSLRKPSTGHTYSS